MTTAQSWRRERARQTEALVAAWFREHGWPNAEPVGPYQAGTDIRKMPGLYVSVKACAEARPWPWVRDAEAAAGGGIAFVVYRPDGMGAKSIADWPVFLTPRMLELLGGWTACLRETDSLTLAEMTELLHGAGYGC